MRASSARRVERSLSGPEALARGSVSTTGFDSSPSPVFVSWRCFLIEIIAS